MPTDQVSTVGKNTLSNVKGCGQAANTRQQSKQVPIQVMVPEGVRRQVAMMSVERGESIRTVVLRALRGIGIRIEDSELTDRRGRRPRQGGHSNGQS